MMIWSSKSKRSSWAFDESSLTNPSADPTSRVCRKMEKLTWHQLDISWQWRDYYMTSTRLWLTMKQMIICATYPFPPCSRERKLRALLPSWLSFLVLRPLKPGGLGWGEDAPGLDGAHDDALAEIGQLYFLNYISRLLTDGPTDGLIVLLIQEKWA